MTKTTGPKQWWARCSLHEFNRQCCNDVFLRQTVEEWAGTYGTEFLDKLASPAHRADVFRYIYHCRYAGLYLDIKTAPVTPGKEVLQKIDYNWAQPRSNWPMP